MEMNSLPFISTAVFAKGMVYRPVGKVLHIAQMVNASDAHRESRSRKSIRGIHHHKLEA